MSNLADLDTLFLVPCKHCGELLEEKDRFCARCGKDQTVPTGDAPAPVAAALAAGSRRDVQASTARAPAVSRRFAIGIAAAALVAMLALALTYRRFDAADARTDAARLQERKASIAEPVRAPAGGEPAGSINPAASPRETPVTAISVPETGVPTPPAGKECNEALAALALCAKQ